MPGKFKLYFVYKLRLKNSGLFYIGMTCDIDQRKAQHFRAINSLIRKLRFNKNKVPTNRREMQAHLTIAREILKGKRILQKDGCRSERYCTIKVIDIFDTPSEASALEGALLVKYKDHPKFLNVKFVSSYCNKNEAASGSAQKEAI
jgi:predicted GIY-YIG superfamily endonuclease